MVSDGQWNNNYVVHGRYKYEALFDTITLPNYGRSFEKNFALLSFRPTIVGSENFTRY